MWIQRGAAITCIVVCALMLMSFGCGIVLFPYEGPKVVITNARRIKFSVEIVDEAGKPVNDVTVDIVRHAICADPFVVEWDQTKTEPARTVSGTFSYDTFGNYAVVVEYRKPGYMTVDYLYATEDDKHFENGGFVQAYQNDLYIKKRINVEKQPMSQVVMVKGSGMLVR